VVDDEQTVRDLAARILRTLGCKVTTCNNGAEAVEYYRKAWKQTDLVILDMVMPEMNGRETFLAMRRINPDIRALLSSGYSLMISPAPSPKPCRAEKSKRQGRCLSIINRSAE